MALITEKKGSLSGGVNQQSAEHRQSHQVEEMVNCVPTIDRGLLKRNPTTKKRLVTLDGQEARLTFEEKMWTYEFDRGSASGHLTEFAFTLTTSGLEILNVNTGLLYNGDIGINYVGSAKDYLIPFVGENVYSATTVKDTVFITNKTRFPAMLPANISVEHKLYGYVWIKRVDPVSGYRYGCDITCKMNDGSTQVFNVILGDPQTDSEVAALDLATRVSYHTEFGAYASGSSVQIVVSAFGDVSEILSVNSLDSFGDTASFGWGHTVDSVSLLPNKMTGMNPIVRVGTNIKNYYWLKYENGSWVETVDPSVATQIDTKTMPHQVYMRLNDSGSEYEWYVEAYDWDDRRVGDNETNSLPSFMDKNQTIKDLLFFKNRFCFITSNSITLSEVGEYGNFFRTSVATLLDSDRIDTGVESHSAINLGYAILTENSIILFSDKAQFQFEGGDILSPSSFKISEILAYEVNMDVRPLLMNDRIFFVARRGDWSAVYQLFVRSGSTIPTQAHDISSHCQKYIHGEISKLSGSAVNDMLFLTSKITRNLIFTYKYLESGNKLEQSAWSKWEFNGQIYSAFAIGKEFHLLIDRENKVEASDWILGSGRWRMSKLWHMDDSPWIMTPQSLESINQFESMAITPQSFLLPFLDNDNTIIRSFVNFGEWVQGKDGNKEIRGTLQFKTIQFSAEEESDFNLWVRDIKRETEREIPSRYVFNRKPFIGGQSKNIRTGIIANGTGGFRINTVSFEGNLNRRATAK